MFKAKGQSGKPLTTCVPYGYKKSDTDKNLWEVDEEAAAVVKRIFKLCISGYGPTQIARQLTADNIFIPSAYAVEKGYLNAKMPPKSTVWHDSTVVHILEKPEYIGHTVNFKTRRKSYKHKKKLNNDRSEWLIFENTHEAIISQHDFDLVQELRRNKRKNQRCGEMNTFSGMVYCADCGSKMYLCRSRSLADDQEHLKCSTYAKDKDECTAHYIRTAVLSEIILKELNNMLVYVNENEEDFVQSAMENSTQKQSAELKKAKKTLVASEKRIAELDRLFTRLYEDNVSGKISDERFMQMSKGYEDEQERLKNAVAELSNYIEKAEQKAADTSQFIKLVRKYEHITELTPDIMHELIEKIVVHAPDKSSGHRTQKIEIHYRFNVAVSAAVADSADYDKKRKAA